MRRDWRDDELRLLAELVQNYKRDEKIVDWKKIKTYFTDCTAKAAENAWYRYEKEVGGVSLPDDGDLSNYQVFIYMRDRPRSMTEICNKFKTSPSDIDNRLESMKAEGYNLVKVQGRYAMSTISEPTIKPPDVSIYDLLGHRFNIALAGDLQAGSKYAQPTAYNKFIKYAYEEFDVRHIGFPGDVTDGIYGYKGHLDELIPIARPLDRPRSWIATESQAKLADIYIPKFPDLQYYMIGGNHDWNHRKINGRNVVDLICKDRPDIHYGGYDVWSVPMTEKAHLRMLHPTGGIAYARSYHLQKGIENMAFEALKEAMHQDLPPVVSFLCMGHYHLTNHTPEPPLHGILTGCFQGQTPYLKAKRLTPHIAGIILEMRVNTRGQIFEVGHRVIDFEEIKNDPDNWPTPEIYDVHKDPDSGLDIMFRFDGHLPEPEKK